MIHLGLSTSAEFTVIWMILKCYYVVDLILDSISIILVFYCIFLIFFYLRINKPNINNTIIGISSFETGINDLFSLTGFYFKSKVIQGSHKGKNMFFNFWALLLKMYIFEVVTFFSRLVVIQTTQCFSGSTYL